MPAYRTILVGTDGSETSFRAVERAAALAAGEEAELVIVSAYTPPTRQEVSEAEESLGEDAFRARGSTPAEECLALAADRATATGAGRIKTQAVDGAPVDVLAKAADEHGADLLVVGNRGLNTLSGRLLGSVPSGVARRSAVDVLIVHTT